METIVPRSPEACAQVVLDTVPLAMRSVRAQMRHHRGLDLSVPQFRALGFVRRQPGASLSEVAQHVGTSLPSASKLVGGLVSRGLISRTPSEGDRRRLVLVLTPLGIRLLESARKGAQAHLARRLETLSPKEREDIVRSLSRLAALFGSEEGIAL